MKAIIIEGPDNSGKNTIINRLLEDNAVCDVIHCSKPKGNTYEEMFENQVETFRSYVGRIIFNDKANNYDILGFMNIMKNTPYKTDAIIFNRAWYGEYVYGQMYREGDPQKIKEMIGTLEYILNTQNIDVYYIQLMSSSTKLLNKNDDGLSLSNADEEKIRKECDLFKEIFEFSKVNKKLIYINNGDEFRSREDIANEAMEFINN